MAKIARLAVLLLVLILNLIPLRAHSWECSIEVDGPSWVKVGRTIDLTASGLPTGGQYYWSSSPYLKPDGATATLTGFKPAYSDYIRVPVRYTTPKGNSCSETKWVYAHPCEVGVSGPAEAKVGEQVTLNATTDCDSGGEFSWSSLPGLVADGATAIYTPQTAGDQEITATYAFPDGAASSGTHALTVKGCTVAIAGASAIEFGENTTLTATANPSGGTYHWSSPLDLIGQGPNAEVSGSDAGEQTVTVTYSLDDADSTSCKSDHVLQVQDCQLKLDALSVASVGAPTLCSAEGQPEGGSCAWLSPTGLLDQGLTAQYTAQTAGRQTFEAEYTTPSGDTCRANYDSTFIKVGSIASPYSCVNSGTTLEKGSFNLTSEPAGYLDVSNSNLSIAPLTLRTSSQSSTETITASITQKSILDDATTTFTVVNPEVKTDVETNLDIKTPDYISKTLSKVGLADKAKLEFSNSLSKKLNCCGYSKIEEGRELTFSIALGAEAGPFTIIGVPLSPRVKDYVSLDLLNLSLSGKAEVAVTADHDPCARRTSITGGGEITATADLGGDLTLKYSRVLVINFHVGGKTSISEKFTPNNGKLFASASWGGLTASIDGKIRVFGGAPLELTPKSKNYFKKDGVLPFEIDLPNF